MSTATIALRTRPRPSLGPALARRRWPLGTIVLSAILHLVGVGALGLAAVVWQEAPPKTYIVNLVPAVAAVGRPHGQASAPPLPARPAELAPPPTKAAPTELPHREARATPPPPEMPARSSARDTSTLPDRTPAPRAAALPRPGDKELPAAALPRATSEPTPRRDVTTPSVPAPPPPVPLGQAAGSAQGAGAVTLSVSDFPYAWYIRAIERKIQERWEGRAIDGRQPEVFFEIGADGRLRRLGIGRSSGNPSYDQLAMRAVSDANPFPPLPAGFGKPTLSIGLQFIFDPRAR
jgi:periplasmic protein TonB